MSDKQTVPRGGDQDGKGDDVDRVIEDAKIKAKEVVDEMTGRDSDPTRAPRE